MPVSERHSVIPSPDPRNANRGTERGREVVRRSLRELGAGRPILLDKHGVSIAGNKTLDAARELGIPIKTIEADGRTLYAIVRTDLDLAQDAKAKELAVTDNRASELGLDWNVDILEDLRLEGVDLDDLFTDDEWRDLLATIEEPGTEGLTDPDEVPDVPEKPITQPGDLWRLGEHRLLCGDSTSSEDVRRLMDGHRAPLMPTDPPYLVNYQGGNHPQSWHNKPEVKDKHWDDYNEGDGPAFFAAFLQVALDEALTENPAVYQFHSSSRQAMVEDAWKANGLLVHQQIIWVKARAVLTRSHYMWQHEPCFYGWVQGKVPPRKPPANARTVWEVDQVGESDGIHPTQKPVELIKRMLEYHTVPRDRIYEPFGGSGTALIAAEMTGRTCHAMEKSPAFVDVILQRWQDFTGHIAEREG